MKKINLISLLIAAVLLASCAKEREPDRIEDPDGNNLLKETFTTTKITVQDRDTDGKVLTNEAGEPKLKTIQVPKVWLYKATVVKTSENDGAVFVGLQNDVRAGFFRFTKDKLQLINANSIYPEETPNNAWSVLNQWDVTHFDTKLDERNGKVTNQEVVDDEKTWYQKRFFNIDFSKAEVAETADFRGFSSSCFKNKKGRIIHDSLQVQNDYFTFVVELNYQVDSRCASTRRWLKSDFTYTAQIRYSFKQLTENPGFDPFFYTGGEFDPLHDKYGYFKTLIENQNENTGQVEYVHIANRWDPNKDHHFFFAKGFPEEYKYIYTDPEVGVFARTNQVLEEAGVKARFYIHDNDGLDGKPKEFGDLRYSFINWIQEIETGSPFGYGPSDANPFTGEIIAANSMVWTAYLRFYVKRLRDKEDNIANVPTPDLYGAMNDFLGFNKDSLITPMSFENSASGDILHRVMMDRTYGLPQWNYFTAEPHQKNIFRPRSNDKIEELMTFSAYTGEYTDFTALNPIMNQDFEELDQVIREEIRTQQAGHCKYPMMNALAGVRQQITAGLDDKEIIDRILYGVAIHEFGHNISLRHNFYGSVDVKNFSHPKAKSSSVMEYLASEDELNETRDWGSYDKAAIQYLFTDGKVDSPKFHLYCTDEHRALNAMCNVWDSGSTPTEILTNMIENYERMYFIRNYRYDRPFWNTASYSSSMLSTMWDVKKFLTMWRSDFTDSKLDNYFESVRPDLTLDQKRDIKKDIERQFHNATIMSVAFFDSVLQQDGSDRPWRNEYDPRTGALTRQGVLFDKLWAVRFLVGDDGFMYDPSGVFNNVSYLSYVDIGKIRPYIEKAFKNNITQRVAMDTWFLGFTRALYSMNSMNFNNSYDNSLVNRIKIVSMTPEEMREELQIDASKLLDTGILVIENSRSPHFERGDQVGYTKINGNYYMTEKFKSPYSYNVFEEIYRNFGSGNINRLKTDFVELYNMYLMVSQTGF